MTQWRHGLAKGKSSRVALYPPHSAQRERRRRILALAHDFQKPLPAHRGLTPDENEQTETLTSSKGKNR